jgi:hypothetical protein
MNNRLINARWAAGFSNSVPTPGQTATPPAVALGSQSGQQAAPGDRHADSDGFMARGGAA